MKEMHWFVYVDDFNAREIKRYDIFNHHYFNEDLKKNFKKNKDDFNTFKEELKKDLMYYFWSKCEWEVIISDWPPSTGGKIEEKIDVYDQVMLNFDVFANYVWEQAHKRKNAKD